MIKTENTGIVNIRKELILKHLFVLDVKFNFIST